MPRLIWRRRAAADLDRLYDFLASKDVDSAQRAIDAIEEGAQILALHPDIGRPINHSTNREWLIDFGDSGYVMQYRLDGRNVVILAVRHQKELGY